MRVQELLFGIVLAGLTVLAACGANKEIRLADNLVDRGRYAEALEVYRRCLATDPDNHKLQQRLATAKQLESRRLMTMADTRLQHDDFETAFDLYADSVRYDPTNAQAVSGLQTVRDKWADQADHLEQNGQFDESIAIHKRILREFREFPRSLEALERIRTEKAARYQTMGQDYQDRGLPGNALIAYLKAQALTPDAPELQKKIQEAVSQIEENTKFELGIQQKRGSRFKASLWALYLNGLFEKTDLPIVLVPGDSDTPYQIELFGKLSRVKTVAKKVTATTKAQDGTTKIPNPAYSTLEAKVNAAQDRVKRLEPPVLDLQNRLETAARERVRRGTGTASPEEDALRKQLAELSGPYRSAVDEYRRLSAQLARIPKYFEKPVYRTETYPAKELRRWIRVTGQATIRTADGTIVNSVPLDDIIEVRDMVHPAIKATATRPAVPEDPATLPKPEELRIQAESRAISKLQTALQDLYATHVETLWEEARRLALNGDTTLATEAFLRAYLSDPMHPTDEVTRYVLEAKQAISLPLEEFLMSLVEQPAAPCTKPATMTK